MAAATPQELREQIVLGFCDQSPEALAGISDPARPRRLALLRAARPRHRPQPELGRDRLSRARSRRRPIAPRPLEMHRPEGAEEVIEADVCIVGSGAGGGVIAGELAAAGKSVVRARDGRLPRRPRLRRARALRLPAPVPERRPVPDRRGPGLDRRRDRGRRRHGDQLDQLPAHPRLGARGVGARARARGTRPSPTSTRHIDAVWERLGVNDDCSDLNGPAPAPAGGAARSSATTSARSPATPIPSSTTRPRAAYMGFGDQSGSKHSTAKTYLLDAQAAGAEIVVRLPRRADPGRGRPRRRRRGRLHDPAAAAGRHGDGRQHRVIVRAPVVVVACGSIESPALLLRSQIGGPAVGDYLRLHPTAAVTAASTPSPRTGSGARRRRRSRTSSPNLGDGHGFLIECGAVDHRPVRGRRSRGARAASTSEMHEPLGSRRAAHQPDCASAATAGSSIDAAGNSVAAVPDHRRARHPRHPRAASSSWSASTRPPAREEIVGSHPQGAATGGAATTSRRSSPTLNVAARSRRASSLLFSAHQMGSCRMGADPQTLGRQPVGRAARHARGLDRRRERLPERLRDQPDADDHGAGAAHRARDRRGVRLGR